MYSPITGHFYALDLRRRTLCRRATAQGKKEHDIQALKRLTKEMLRQGAPPGRQRQVLYVGDKAAIDFHFWYHLKTAAGICFTSLEKENKALEVMGNKAWDKADPINQGVLSTAG